MTIPMEFQHASESFERFLADARDEAGLATRNQTYTMVEAVLRVFRRRLSVREAIAFANVLPPVLRALFVTDWDPDEPSRPFADCAAMAREVQDLRRHHNFAPGTAIRDVAIALRRHCDEAVLDRVLATMPDGAFDFWRV